MSDGTVGYLVMSLNKSQVKVSANTKYLNYQLITKSKPGRACKNL